MLLIGPVSCTYQALEGGSTSWSAPCSLPLLLQAVLLMREDPASVDGPEAVSVVDLRSLSAMVGRSPSLSFCTGRLWACAAAFSAAAWQWGSTALAAP